ncbi:MAG: AzlC family ABC transporter permease [Mailhella sp.]|nr:AzlC family ABC transporter permease [Mailhella sp.]
MNCRTPFIQGLRDGIPIALGYFAVSFTLGIACRNIGMGALAAAVMSASNLTSAGEFAAVGIIAAQGGLVEIALSQLVINLRYMLMSCALSQKLAPETPFWHRFLIGYGVTDEIFGISVAWPGRLAPSYVYGAVAVAAPGWTLGTFLGVILGNVLPARIVSALSVALFGMFVAIIVPPAKQDRVLAGLVAVSMAASWAFAKTPCLAGISGGMRVIILTVVISAAAALLFPRREGGRSDA